MLQAYAFWLILLTCKTPFLLSTSKPSMLFPSFMKLDLSVFLNCLFIYPASTKDTLTLSIVRFAADFCFLTHITYQ